jgi:hypothetical protein
LVSPSPVSSFHSGSGVIWSGCTSSSNKSSKYLHNTGGCLLDRMGCSISANNDIGIQLRMSSVANSTISLIQTKSPPYRSSSRLFSYFFFSRHLSFAYFEMPDGWQNVHLTNCCFVVTLAPNYLELQETCVTTSRIPMGIFSLIT